MSENQTPKTADGALIAESSKFFFAVATTAILVAGLAGIVNATPAEPTASPPVADVAAGPEHVAADATHPAVPGTDPAGVGHGEQALAKAPAPQDHPAAPGAADQHGPALTPAGMAASEDDGDHAAHRGSDGSEDGGEAHAGATMAAEHHAGGVCADDHPATRALVEKVRFSLTELYPDVATLVARGYIPYFDALVPGGYPTPTTQPGSGGGGTA